MKKRTQKECLSSRAEANSHPTVDSRTPRTHALCVYPLVTNNGPINQCKGLDIRGPMITPEQHAQNPAARVIGTKKKKATRGRYPVYLYLYASYSVCTSRTNPKLHRTNSLVSFRARFNSTTPSGDHLTPCHKPDDENTAGVTACSIHTLPTAPNLTAAVLLLYLLARHPSTTMSVYCLLHTLLTTLTAPLLLVYCLLHTLLHYTD